MKSVLYSILYMGISLNCYSATIYQCENSEGSMILTNKKERFNSNYNCDKSINYPDSNSITRPMTKKEIEQEEIKIYKQKYQEWLKLGGKNSGIRAPIKPVRIEHELNFWPVLYGGVWVGTGLVGTDYLEINEGFDTHEDCMSNKNYYIKKYSNQLRLAIPQHIKVAKAPKKSYRVACYSTIDPVEYDLVP